MGAGPAFANSYLISPNPNSGQKFPMQGDCSQHGINPADPQIDVTRSTWACQGASNQMLRVFYQNGPEVCVYIDNFTSNDGEKPALFVPLNSSDEWLAFEAHKPGGVHLRYGCPGQIVSDDCGNRFSLPDAPASDNPGDVIHVATSGDYTADYACPYTGANGGGDA
ncbi:MAG TPA: hypothetical protein VHB73_01210, partial [Alphaproteobacteria bacterium]|nr:hypothetical protein [Alphaproteobacteria bacterium]